jgi:hypothetical protein
MLQSQETVEHVSATMMMDSVIRCLFSRVCLDLGLKDKVTINFSMTVQSLELRLA